ncbi:hypothetical protein DNTS_031054 [Danionella cerebrum]|uniref:C2H2-type domain-containing protein n=1 Tax=Danionella cerebrum TaxID=2873325 RepID=A0A553MYP5_9TELE|nr:hypothetical protein DNTS_031054 [Danionella translucida]
MVESSVMSEMKTPDFDDLLAAFDIPDATSLDAKEAIHGNQDEANGHLKPSEMCMDPIPHPVPGSDAPVVSVIVKNTSRQNSYETLIEKESNFLHNGFKSLSSTETRHSGSLKLDSSSVNGDSLKRLLSSCLNALAALNGKKDVSAHSKDFPVMSKGSLKLSPISPRSPLEVVKQYAKHPDSPISICSDSSGKASPAVATGSPPAIPRVRIKTIKTSSGEIKRTIMSILPDSETEDFVSPVGSSPSLPSVQESFSKSSKCHSNELLSEAVFEDGSEEASKKVLTETKTVKKLQTPKDSIKDVKHGKTSPTQMDSLANTTYLPKALHLANLNLVPHSVAASVTARSSTKRQEPSRLSSSVVCSSVPLVHQVKKAPPNIRAVVPNTAAGTLNRLLNYSNPVPTYVPDLSPPPDINIKLPPQGYCCLECGDTFGLEKSLAFHYSRKSVHIEVACTHCSKTLVFYNRCALLAHARDHKKKGMVMQCTQLFMKPIAVDQMFAPTNPKTSGHTLASGKVEVSCQSQGVLPLYPDKVLKHGFKCLDCNMQMEDYRALAGHYQKSSAAEALICKVCSMLLPNKCSHRAHQRIHTHKSPYSCPECGALSCSVDIQKHVKENCLHYTRKIGFSCLHCEMLFVSLSQLKSHIEEEHCEVFYKCTICPVAFKSSEGCFMHAKCKHGVREPSHQAIYKCSCQKVFKKKQLLYQHFHNRICVFKCPECTSFFWEKLHLVQHFKTMHGGVFTGESERTSKKMVKSEKCQSILTKPGDEDSVKKMESSVVKKSRSEVGRKNAGWECGVCHLWVPDRESYVNHMKTNHSRSLKRQPCRLCERSFSSSLGLKRHIRNDHNGKRKAYTCWYCTNETVTFTDHSLLKTHISLMHGIKNPDFCQMVKLEAQEVSEFSGETLKKRKVHEADDDRGAHQSKRRKLEYRCAKCGFTCEEQVEFQEHIPQHAADSNTPQCQHCGLCFTSQLALSRHLYIVHKVREAEEREIVQNGDPKSEQKDLDNETMPLLLNESSSFTKQEQLGLRSEPTDNICSTVI